MLIWSHDAKSPIARILHNGRTENMSKVLCLASTPLAFVHFVLSVICDVVVAILWFIPVKGGGRGT